jgi:ACS family D-galactonate transporter-like MFS transporter
MFLMSATSTLIDEGQRVGAIVAQYPHQVATLESLTPATSAELKKNSTDALPKALGEVCLGNRDGAAKCAQVTAAAARNINALVTASKIDATTLNALSGGSTDSALIVRAQSEIAKAFKISNAAALSKLIVLAAPSTKAALTLIGPYANQLVTATTDIPPSQLAYLEAHGAEVAKAVKQNPTQWQRWWWVCFAGQIVFLPFIFVLRGRWSPANARQDELEHEMFVERELARLGQIPAGSPAG